MKVIRLTTLHGYGGQEKKLINFTERPELLNHEYVFAAIGTGGHCENILRSRGYKVKIFNLPIAHKNIKNIFIIAKWLRQEKPDIIHTAASEANFHGVLAAKLAGVPVIIVEEIGVPNTHSKKAKLIFKYVYKLAHKIIAVSKEVKRVIIENGEAPAKKIEVLYNLTPLPKNHEKINHSKFQWVFVSRLIPRKNTTTLITAFSKLDIDKRGELHIVGDGVEREMLENQVKELKLENSVIFHGFQPDPEKYIAQADVFVLPAFDEGFGIVVIEAMFLKKACLCGYGGGIPEYMVHNENGWFFDPYSVDDLIEKMNNILELDKEKIAQVGQIAYDRAIDKFTIEKYVQNLEKIYKDTKDFVK